jgi:tripartite-type tricarboxylate transporter receptor subunit TctC
MISRREFISLLGGAVAFSALLANTRLARAQAYPIQPVHLLVGFAPGGFTDITARLIGPWLSDRLGQQFVVENRPGASSNIATAAVVRAVPDGYTLLEVADANAFTAALYDKLSFNFIRDIVPVASIDRAPFVMAVPPSSPAKTVAEFIASKANKGKINMGASGPGSSSQLFGELFKTMTGIEMAAVQYRGVGSALPDLMSGRLDVIFLPVATAAEQINAAKVRALGVTSSKPVAVLSDVPAIGDTVAGYEAVSWTGIGAPAKTPDDIVTTLNRHVNAALADATFKARLAEVGLEPFASTPSEFAKFIAEQTEKWGKIIRAAGIKAE